MSGPAQYVPPRGIRRGAALTLVFASVLATGAAAGSWVPEGRKAVRLQSRTAAEVTKGTVASSHGTGAQTRQGARADAQELVSRSRDRWAAAYSAREYEDFQQAMDGAYVGVGLWIRQGRDDRTEITRVQRGGPAARAGIRPGDVLRTVDGARVAEQPVTDVVARLRGGRAERAAPGTRVVLGLERAGHGWTRALRRERLDRQPVTVTRSKHTAARPEVAIIRVDAFTKGSGHRVRKAAEAARGGSGMILDLRGNSGGLVQEAAQAASAFLDDGIVATYDEHGRQRALHARPGGDTATPLVVLVDGTTMSAAELVTGALQDRGRAVVVGSRTYGKGSVQMPRRMPDGSVAELTVGHYYTPAGRSLEGAGVEPDLAVPPGEDAEAAAEGVLGGLGGGT